MDTLKTSFKDTTYARTKNNLLNHLKSQELLACQTEKYQVKSIVFCNKFFAHITGISEYILKSVLSDFHSGCQLYQHGNTGIMKQSTSVTQFIAWTKEFAEWYGQYSPTKEVIVLSYWLRKGVLYKLYCEDAPEPHIAESTFYKYFEKYFGPSRVFKDLPCICISKDSSHSVCNECVALNNYRRFCKNENELKIAKSLINQHKETFGGAFRKVQEVKQLALSHPTDHCLLQVDGMDNYKSYLPKYMLNAKETQGSERLTTKIIGCIIWSGHYASKRKLIYYLHHDQVR